MSLSSIHAQTYGNEWINYNQQYFKFKVWQDGIYRLDYETLANNGVPMADFTAANIQLFGREKEIPIYVVDGGDNQLNPGDYILFYAQKNDGWIDSLLYQNPTDIANPKYSLYNDTIQYFFTWNGSSNNLRFSFENDVNFSSYTPAPYWMYLLESNYNNFYLEGKRDVNGASVSRFEPGEGYGMWHANGVPNGYNLPINLPTLSPYQGSDAPLPKFHGKVVANSSNLHHYQWRIGSFILVDDTYAGFKFRVTNTTFPTSLLGNGNTVLNWNIIDDQGVPTDFQSITYHSLLYAKQTTLNGLNRDRVWLKNSNTAFKIRLDITNANITEPIAFVFGSTPKRIQFVNSGGVWQGLVSNSSNGFDQTLIIQDMSTVISVQSVSAVNSTSYFTNFGEFLMDASLLMVYHPSMQAASNEYKEYRQSLEGGSHNVILANIEELYLQYGGGVSKHILGIRRFAHQAFNNALSEKPVGLFLMGKGVSEYDGARNNPSVQAMSLIPSFGYPSSDVAITSHLEGSGMTPLIPTGRITARDNSELSSYLQKVKQYEQQQDPSSVYNEQAKDWQKHILHFGGGSSASQQNQLKGFLNQMKVTIEDSLFGGYVTSVFKTSSAPLDPTILNSVTQRLEQGVSLMTFFAHSTADGFEINVDDPSNWNNTGKYPVVVGNGCYPGDVFGINPSTSDRFVKTVNEGAIAFMGPVKLAYETYLNIYCQELYLNFSKKSYGDNLSSQMKKTIRHIDLTFGQNVNPEAFNYFEHATAQMVLNGDPMIKLNWHEKPEINITQQSVFVNPQNVTLGTDSLEFNLILTNLGRSIVDTFRVEIRRDFPFTNMDSVYFVSVPKLNYKDTIQVKMPLQANISAGVNNF
jgi:hypothetical protein